MQSVMRQVIRVSIIYTGMEPVYYYSQIRFIATSREETKSAQNVAIIRITDFAGFINDPCAF